LLRFALEATRHRPSTSNLDPANRAFFAGVVSGLDLTRPLSKDEVAAIRSGMDRFGVLVFHDQRSTTTSSSCSAGWARSSRPRATSRPRTARQHGPERHLQPRQEQQGLGARDDAAACSGWAAALALRLSFKPVPAKYSLLSARHIRRPEATPKFADMRAA
jgi:alpha-ketoglutarate-dependent 2,4-dichlorophenoxyacetate dioxygenase